MPLTLQRTARGSLKIKLFAQDITAAREYFMVASFAGNAIGAAAYTSITSAGKRNIHLVFPAHALTIKHYQKLFAKIMRLAA